MYAAAVPGRLEWRFTLNIDIDCVYWFEQIGGKASLHLLEPVLSLSDASALLPELARCAVANVHDALRGWDTACSAAGLTLELPAVSTITYRDYTMRGGTVAMEAEELLRMERLLTGRCFSRDELLRFLEFHELEQAGEDWKSYVQAAFLRGRIRLHNGIESLRKRRYPWSKPVRQHKCRRCGSSGERMHPATCGCCSGACVYCEECLAMGRIQSCSLLLYGVGETFEDSTDYRPNKAEPEALIHKWGLSPAQTEAVRSGLAYLSGPRVGTSSPGRFLIWAVTISGYDYVNLTLKSPLDFYRFFIHDNPLDQLFYDGLPHPEISTFKRYYVSI